MDVDGARLKVARALVSSSTVDVDGARLKVARAREHLSDLQGQVGKWLVKAESPRFTIDVEDGGRVHIVRLGDVPWVAVKWSLILGDVLHNLRSALGLLAWQADIAGGGIPDLAGAATAVEPILLLPPERQISWITKRLDSLAGELDERVYGRSPVRRASCGTASDRLEADPASARQAPER